MNKSHRNYTTEHHLVPFEKDKYCKNWTSKYTCIMQKRNVYNFKMQILKWTEYIKMMNKVFKNIVQRWTYTMINIKDENTEEMNELKTEILER